MMYCSRKRKPCENRVNRKNREEPCETVAKNREEPCETVAKNREEPCKTVAKSKNRGQNSGRSSGIV